MNSRIQTADLAKGIAVLLMIQVHLTEVFARPVIFSGMMGHISLFLGGPLVAPVFLIIFGYFLAASQHTLSQLIYRSAKLLLIGFLLNVGLNLHLFIKIYAGIIQVNQWEYLFGVDILMSVGLCISALALIRIIFKKMLILYLILALAIVLGTPYLTTLFTIDSWLKYPLAFLGGHYRWSYFPLFPWLSYPLIGYAFFLGQQRIILKTMITKRLQLIGLLALSFFVVFTGYYMIPHIIDLSTYYHHGFLLFLWILFFLLLWFVLLTLINKDFSKTQIFSYIKWIGKHVTTVYILQWIIIGNIGTMIFKTQSLTELLVWYVLILVAVSLGTYISVKSKRTWIS